MGARIFCISTHMMKDEAGLTTQEGSAVSTFGSGSY